MNINKPAAVFSLSLISASAFAIDFTYLNGDPLTGYTQLGTPTNIFDRSGELPSDILTNIYGMLPESQYVNPAFIDDSLQSNIIVDNDFNGTMTATLTFLNEGAGYRNAFGYFLYDPDSPPATYNDIDQHVIILPNASKPSAGELAQGDSVSLDVSLVAGQAMGFFVVPNGWGYSGSYGTISGLGPWNQPFYSLPHLNPEPEGLKNHNVVFYDAANEFLVFGFDDQHRSSGDNDFNDILVSIETTPIYALEGINIDGSVDANSYQVLEQTNTQITSTTYYPSQNSRATIAFEDLWPRLGDYDFNDVVLSYQFEHTLNNRNQLISFKLYFDIQAMGATYHNGLSLSLPNVASSNISSSSISRGGILLRSDLIEPGHSEANLVLIEDFQNAVISECTMYRTLESCRESVGETYVVEVTLAQPVDTSQLGPAPYDMYLFAVDDKYHGLYGTRSWELHTKNNDGSSYFDRNLLGIEDDRSNNQHRFINKNNIPWAINIAGEWQHPLENIDILRAYPLLKQWVSTNGESAQDWYRIQNANTNFTY